MQSSLVYCDCCCLKGWACLSQYIEAYCDPKRELGKAVLRYSHCTCDTAGALGERALGERGAGHAARAGADARGVGGAALRGDTAGPGHDTVGARPATRPLRRPRHGH